MADESVPRRRVADRYRLDRCIGRGGSGAVWRGHDERLRRPVAVKEITLSADADEAAVGRMRALREARAATRIAGPGVVQVYDIVEENGGAYLIMELVDAPNLSALVRRVGPFAAPDAAGLGLQILDTLVAAHDAGIVHRDVKPSNVLVDGDVPRLTDFGIARLVDDATVTVTGVVMGTPSYMAPEHARGEAVGPAADIYGLGATLYYAVEGTAPFGSGGSLATVLAVLNEPHRPPERAGPLAPVLDDLLVKDPALRPDADALRARLQTLQTLATTAASEPVGGIAGAALDDATVPGQVTDEVDVITAETAIPAAVSTTAGMSAQPAADDVAEHRVDHGEPLSGADADMAAADAAARELAARELAAADAGAPDIVAGGDATPDIGAPDVAARGVVARDAVEPDLQATPTTGDGPPRPLMLVALLVVALLAVVFGATRLFDGPTEGDRPVAAAPEAGDPGAADPEAAEPTAAPGDPAVAPAPGASAPASTAPDPTPPADGVLPAFDDVEVPADWVAFEPADLPYRVAHPPGWQVIRRSATVTELRDTATGTYVRLDWVAARRNPIAAWRQLEPAFAARKSNYERIRMRRTRYQGDRAALWEYRYSDGGADLHAYNLGVNRGDRGFALNLQARQSEFASARRLWPYFLASYEFEAQ